jgi:xanthine dehydrogenase YagT iron-sulfur-binding subunit
MASDPNNPDTESRSPEEKQREGAVKPSIFGRFTRRSFLSQLGAAGIAATASPVFASAPPAEAAEQSKESGARAGTVPLTLRVNGKAHALNVDPRTTLLDCLRENLNLPGTKKGCDHGQCGACTVHVNGARVNSCLSLALMHGDDEITTIEGIGQPGNLHPVQAAFIEHDAYQCGYCTSGQIMSAVALAKEQAPVATEEDVKRSMYGNICRCGAYPNIVAAVQAAYRSA